MEITSKPYSSSTVEDATSRPPILLLTQVLPYPPDAGPKIKTFNLIKYLAKSFSITLVSFVRADNTPEHLAALREYCSEIYTVPMKRARWRDGVSFLKSLLINQPFLMVRDESSPMSQLLQKLCQENDYKVVHADQLNMAQFALPLPVPAKLLDEHNAVWTIPDRLRSGEKNPAKRLALQLETYKLRRYEHRICSRFDRVLAVSEQDQAALDYPCEIIPIGVDAVATEPLKLKPGSLNLVSLGTMFYPPNVEGTLWFGQNVFPLIQKQQPQATYIIVGARPPQAVYQMAEQNPGIKVLGYVKDLRPVLEDSAGLVVPLLSGGGMRVKILDALALGLPIVATTIGAEGVQLKHNETALLADEAETFATAALQLLNPQGPGKRLAEAGRGLALNIYDFRQAYKPLDNIYAQLIKK